MHIEDIFEDLEAQFEAGLQKSQRDSFTGNTRALEIQTFSLMSKELIAPILGKEFLAGLDSVAPIWHIYPTKVIRKITLHDELDESLPRLRNLSVDLETFLGTLPMPCAIRWRMAGEEDYLTPGTLHSISRNLMFIYVSGSRRPIAVPIAALGQLIIESVDNLNGDF